MTSVQLPQQPASAVARLPPLQLARRLPARASASAVPQVVQLQGRVWRRQTAASLPLLVQRQAPLPRRHSEHGRLVSLSGRLRMQGRRRLRPSKQRARNLR